MAGRAKQRAWAFFLASTLGVAGAFSQQAKKVKDQAEFDLLQLVNKEAPNTKRIELIDQWKQKYPDSEFKEDRAMVLVQTYQALGKGQEMWGACEELLAINPKSAPGLFFLMSLTTSLGDPTKYDKGEGYTKQFLALIPELYKDKTKPEELKEKKVQEASARKTLGQIAMARKDYLKAETLYTDYLKWEPNAGNISYALGNAMLLQKDKTKQIPALWHLARAAYYSGEDALPDASKKQLQAFFEKTYVTYHGSKDGMQDVIDASLKEAFPPAGWKILSQGELTFEKMEKIRIENPQLHTWLLLKEALQGSGGTEYWTNNLKGSAMPKFKGKVVSSNPPARPKEVIVGISRPDLSEVKLILEQPAGKIEAGTEIEFEAAEPKEFTPEPFMITADVANARVTGLPKATGPAPRAVPKKVLPRKK